MNNDRKAWENMSTKEIIEECDSGPRMKIDNKKRTLEDNGKTIQLTKKEHAIIKCLMYINHLLAGKGKIRFKIGWSDAICLGFCIDFTDFDIIPKIATKKEVKK